MFKIFKSTIPSFFLASSLLLVFFAPNTLAIDKLEFNPEPASEYTLGNTPYEVAVGNAYDGEDFDVRFGVAKLGEDPVMTQMHTFTFLNETYKFKWDGKINGQTVAPGDYKVYITIGFSNVPELTKEFKVKQAQLSPYLIFKQDPVASFNPDKENMEFQVELKQYKEPVDVDFQIKPEGEASFGVQTLKYAENGTRIFTWDGKKNGQKMPAGSYEAFFLGSNLSTLNRKFNLNNGTGPTLKFTTDPTEQHALTSGNYKVSVDLSGYKKDTEVKAAVILSNSNLYIPQDEYTYKANGTHEFSWDISDYEPGTYQLRISGEDTDGNFTNELDHEFTIVEKQALLTFDPTPPANYTMNSGKFKATVKISNGNSDTKVSAYIVNPENDEDVSKDSFTYTVDGEKHEFQIDMTGYGPGSYELKFYGEDKDKVKTNILPHKISVLLQPLVASEMCAGYKDLKKTDWSCPAAEWAKAQGIMTGKEDGSYFDGYTFLNRAEEAKIILMAYKKFTPNTDYCHQVKPFPDVFLGQWYSNYICLGKNLKVLTGYLAPPDRGKFVPARPVLLTEMFCMGVRPLNETLPQGLSFSGLASDQWYAGCAKYVKDKGYFEATTILPSTEATRFNALNFLYAMHLDGKF